MWPHATKFQISPAVRGLRAGSAAGRSRGSSTPDGASGFTLAELTIALVLGLILLAMAAPIVGTVWSQYRIVLAAQSITSQMQYARMKAVSSNESFRVNFPVGQNLFQVETSAGVVVSNPVYLPNAISWNTTDSGSDISFPGRYVSFLPSGNIPITGNGSAGRVKIINDQGIRIDIVVSNGGVTRQTPPYKSPPAPF